MELLFAVVAIAFIGLLFLGKKQTGKFEHEFDEYCRNNGLSIIHKAHIKNALVGLDKSKPSVVWMNRLKRDNIVILNPEKIKGFETYEKSGKPQTYFAKIKTNDISNPSLELDFTTGQQQRDDFIERLEILFTNKT